MENPTHLLSLKVMRVSRPELASAWQPFYSSSPSFSAHSTASIVSLQTNSPLPGHPKTLRDLTHASELLTLPSSFGSIQLGETFSSCLCVNNEAHTDVHAVSIKVEMQTATAKVILAEFGGPDHKLVARNTLESIVHHEIKELGQHVLACAVTYRLPPNSRSLSSNEHPDDPNLQTFRKFYKFAVTNPLSVKTKVHLPKSPTAMLSPAQRDKVFLEVHIQNLTQEPMHFERMLFECAECWDVEDVNNDEVDGQSSGPKVLMQPQDIRQCIYILTSKASSLTPFLPSPGSIIPLGRLDIFWRSSFGEPGRLLTSMLTRRIPIPPIPAQPPASALPPYLKRNISTIPPSRPQSPQLNQSRPGTPPPSHRPGSPSHSRPSSITVATPRPQSPFLVPVAASLDLDVNLVIRDIPQNAIRIEKPFTIPFTLVVSSALPQSKENVRRTIKVVVQHLRPHTVSALSFSNTIPPVLVEILSPRPPSSGLSTPSTATPTFNYALAHQKLVAAASPRQRALDTLERNSKTNADTVSLPPPHFTGDNERKIVPSSVLHTGPSAVYLPAIELKVSRQATDQLFAKHDFELSYLPTQKGFMTVGGLRILLVEDVLVNEGGTIDDSYRMGDAQARVLKEWDVVSEVWVLP
ncbi:hypothetical protein H0H81_008338 [Sphagnurus paluster]|uniref:DUF974-domain-containing protein n=1 Tax=Sphagnurus paluster TaxID=117069 RepID=A0A9P7KLE8_9AGAR|nr:hypothetical protein H0H81_008338 [Sphagnurus paluster]